MRVANYPRITLILRNVSQQLTEVIVEAIASAELDCAMEITCNSANFDDAIDNVRRFPAIPVGAGTVLTVADADRAAAAGCQFVLSPTVLAADVVSFCHDEGMLVVSGAYTPTEIAQARLNGADIVKLFPVRELPERYVRDVRAPLGPVPFMAVGGVTIDNAASLFAQGFDFIGIGSGLFEGASTPEEVRHRLLDLVAACGT